MAAVPRESPHVLVIDDDRATQKLLTEALGRQGFTVAVEKDGEWGLKTFEKKAFDAVLLDILLPGLNGYDVARKMRTLPKGRKTPIIMISGVYKNALHQREAVQKHGAYAFLEKPLRLQALYDTLKSALGDKYPRARRKVEAPPPPPVDDDEQDEKTGEILAYDKEARDEVTQVETQARKADQGAYHAIKGDFSQHAFAEVLAEVYRWKATGALLLRRDKAKKIVFFRDGMPRSAKSNLLSECLGRVMVREKMISEAECEESLKRMKSSKRMQGTVLIEMGCISPHNLQHALQLQMQTKLFDVFAWDSGDYQFNPKADLPGDVVDVGLNAAQVILEGVRKYYDAKRLQKWFGDVGPKYVHPSESPLYVLQDAGLGEEEQQLLQACDGHKTVATLRALAILPPLDTDRLLYAMRCAQMVELKDAPASGKPRPNIARLAESTTRPPPLPPGLAAPPQLPSKPAFQVPPPPPPGHSRSTPGVQRKSDGALPMPWPEAKAAERFDVPAIPTPAPPARPPKAPAVDRPIEKRASLLPELSSVLSTSGLTGDETTLRERLAGKVAAMRKLDFYEILNLPRSASREEVKRAYFAAAKEFHPDKHFSSSSGEVRMLAQQIYDLISQAHDTLTDPTERARYDKELKAGKPREMGDEVGKILAAEGKFQKGEELMRRREYAAAHQHFQDAIQLYGDEGEFHAWLGWSRFQMSPKDPQAVEEAERAIDRAISLNPKLDKGYLFLGYIHKADGRPDKAEKAFEKAIQANPDCTEALRELRLLGKSRR